jgi:hypothetical protein
MRGRPKIDLSPANNNAPFSASGICVHVDWRTILFPRSLKKQKKKQLRAADLNLKANVVCMWLVTSSTES